MTDFIDYLKTQYKHKTDALAFFKNSLDVLHVQASEIRKVFDTVPEGVVSSKRDIILQGTLYYDNLDGFYRYVVSTVLSRQGDTCIRIQFFRNESTHSNAEFISVPCTSQSLTKSISGTGTWQDVPMATGPTEDKADENDQFTILKKKYSHHTPASALFFKNVKKAVRVEVPAIGKEFTDGAYIGKDPEGFLYYNYLSDLSGNVKYTVSKVTNSDNKICAKIQFYRDTTEICHAEFLAEDPEGTVAAAGLDNYTSSGDWKDLNIGSATASIRKYSDDDELFVTVGSIHKKATITNQNKVLSGQVVDVHGILYFKDINKFNGIFASYNDDRIVFYENDNSGTDFYAYFIPNEASANELGIKSANTKILTKVEWKNI